MKCVEIHHGLEQQKELRELIMYSIRRIKEIY